MSEWKEVTGANLIRFEEPGSVVEGKLVGTEEGMFGDMYILETSNGRENLPSFTALNTKMKVLEEGTQVRITYLGEVKSEKSGRVYKDFKVETK